ncbi:hypothetical protein [Erwinia sp. JUb26]|uniref:MrpH family fimbial adhesin n=1 Tax=Erwinia sp. JUb26 TaxID=2485126 RepID=UPI000FB996A0|nr:hypothetical protein [Erwinia sp. JUb26]ROR06348.1 hypothetical protein EC836_108275 [Erwinia sp. JUb26]
MRFFYILCFCILNLFSSSAWSVVTMEFLKANPGVVNGNYSWPSQPTTGVMCHTGGCKVGVCLYIRSISRCGGAYFKSVNIPAGATDQDAWKAFTQKFGQNGGWAGIMGGPYDKMCAGMAVTENLIATLIPGSNCAAPPGKDQVECSIQDSLTLNHNTLAANSLNGNRASKGIIIKCNLPATMTLKLLKQSDIELGNDGLVTTTLYSNDVNLISGMTLSVPEGDTRVNVSSVLHAKALDIPAGPRQGSGTMMLEFY